MAQPILPQDDRFNVWLKPQLYTGPTGTGRFVPNVNDLIIDYDVGFERVSGVVDLIYQSVPWTKPQETGITTENLLLGVSDDFTQQSYRIFIDTLRQPYRMSFDSQLKVYATSSASSIRVFKGYDISNDGEVISIMYNSSGVPTGDLIPLVTAVLPDANNVSVKVPANGWSTMPLPTGEIVTAVVYDDAGVVLSLCRLRVEDSAFVKAADTPERYVTGIALESPYLSLSDDKLLQIPVNVPLSSVPLMGIVTYSVGNPVRVALDSGRMELIGMNEYVGTNAGQRQDLVLQYTLGSDETSSLATGPNLNKIAVAYEVEVLPVQGAYNTKLFVVPYWTGALTGWRLDWYLYNLERTAYQYVTPHVQLAVGSAAFQPLTYGVEQSVTYVLNLADIPGDYTDFYHVQNVRITLVGDGIQDRTPWYIRYMEGQDPQYGGGLSARVTRIAIGDSTVRLEATGSGTLAEWLEKVYYPTIPLRDPFNEPNRPPAPTHFVLTLDGLQYTFPIDQWNQDLQITSPGVVGAAAVVHFERRIGTTVLQLAASPFVIVHVN
jgi:hypothetical protein